LGKGKQVRCTDFHKRQKKKEKRMEKTWAFTPFSLLGWAKWKGDESRLTGCSSAAVQRFGASL
jgi:hypothetical protein